MVRITIKVVPGAGFNTWKCDKSGTLVCYLKNQPEKGLANRELLRLLATALRVTQQDICILSGLTQRRKVISITGFDTRDQILNKLGLDNQVDKQLELFGKQKTGEEK